MGTQRREDTLVNKEKVRCENCRNQYSYLYEARHPFPDQVQTEFSSPAAQMRYWKILRKRLYKSTADAWHACPNCNYYQSWMIGFRRSSRLKSYLGFIALLGAILGLGILSVTLSGATAGLPLGSLELGLVGLLGIAATAVVNLPWLYLMWDPNKGVDTQTYEATPLKPIDPVRREEVASRYATLSKETDRELSPMRRRIEQYAWTIRVAIAALMTIGVMMFLAPTLFPDVIFLLSEYGALMLPFYIGAACIIMALAGTSWEFIFRKRRQRPQTT